MKLQFDEIESLAPRSPGLYEIYTSQGIPLKVGIAANLRSRLGQHAKSRQGGLKLKRETENPVPGDIVSKQSILAKHLYFDKTITESYDLKREKDRQEFLRRCCYLIIMTTPTKEAAREIEVKLEATGKYRYVGIVVTR